MTMLLKDCATVFDSMNLLQYVFLRWLPVLRTQQEVHLNFDAVQLVNEFESSFEVVLQVVTIGISSLKIVIYFLQVAMEIILISGSFIRV